LLAILAKSIAVIAKAILFNSVLNFCLSNNMIVANIKRTTRDTVYFDTNTNKVAINAVVHSKTR